MKLAIAMWLLECCSPMCATCPPGYVCRTDTGECVRIMEAR